MKRLVFLLLPFFLIVFSCDKDENDPNVFRDSRDGQEYRTVQIGTQTWMAENLNYAPSTGNYWCYDDDPANCEVYGKLYDWETAKMVAPDGWHLPSYSEWINLMTFLGGESVAGGKMKETGLSHWGSPNTGATNESGFTGLPGGHRSATTGYFYKGSIGDWWSALEYDADDAWSFYLWSGDGELSRDNNSMTTACSVRCIKD